MRVRDIKNVIKEMDTDLKSEYSLYSGRYDFYAKNANIDSAYEASLIMRNLEKKRNILNSVNVDNLEIGKLLCVEDYLTKLGKDSWFSRDEIDDFVEFILHI